MNFLEIKGRDSGSDPIRRRYSCRSFQPQCPAKSTLEELMRAGMQAPSARNERPWEFLAVTSGEGREKIARSSPYAACCRQAPAVILALANLERIPRGSAWWVQDMSACVENILIEAVRLELGGVWLGIYPRMERVRAIQTAFDLSDAMVPFAAIPVGYPLTAEEAPDRYEADRIHWES